jgi:hypothetical protein
MPRNNTTTNNSESLGGTVATGTTSDVPREQTITLVMNSSGTGSTEALPLPTPENTSTTVPEPVECPDCNRNVPISEIRFINDDRSVCNSCFENYSACDDCGDIFLHVDMYSTVDANAIYCEECVEEDTFICNNCEDRFDGDAYHSTPNGNVYCEGCRTDNFTLCRGCAEEFEDNLIHECTRCSEYFCNNCWETHPHNESNLSPAQRRANERVRRQAEEQLMRDHQMRNPNRKPSTKFFKGKTGTYLTIDRFVGIEIEAERGDNYGLGTILPPEVGVSRDGSLSDRGVECQTPPASLDKAEDFVMKTCAGLKGKGYKGTTKAGLHVHIDARDIKKSHKKITQVIKTYYAVEDILFSVLPPSRWQNRYCQRLAKDYLYANFKKNKSNKDLEKKWYKEQNEGVILSRKLEKYDNSRYFGLNIHSLFFRGTIELRYHSGTVNERKILNWVELQLKIFDWAINHYEEEAVEKLFNMETSWNKFNNLMGLLNISYTIRDYLTDRINKFNPDFVIKFNKGKEARIQERKASATKQRKLNALMKKIKAEQGNEIREKFRHHYPTTLAGTPEVERLVDADIRQLAYRQLPNEYRTLDVKTEHGFLRDEEVVSIVGLINAGRSLEREAVNANRSGSEDIEE